MNFRRIVMASGSRLWKRTSSVPGSAGVENSLVRHRAYTMMAAPTDGIKPSAKEASIMKRKMCVKLKKLSETGETVEEKLDEFTKEEGVSVTQQDLIRWAKLLDKYGNHQHALEIFEWMMKNRMRFSPSHRAIYVDLIAKTDGIEEAVDYFRGIDPTFDDRNFSEKNWPVYEKLMSWYNVKPKEIPRFGGITIEYEEVPNFGYC